jgi:hypothetical protein
MLAITLVHRTATGMAPLAILLTVTGRESLGTASVALTCWTLAGALGQPAWVGMVGRRRRGATLAGLGVATASAHVGVAAVDGPAVSILFATLAGATLPPVTALVRDAIVAITDGDVGRRDRAFAMESAFASSAFVLAPLVVAASRVPFTGGPMVACGLLLAVAALASARWAGPLRPSDGGRAGTGHGEVVAGPVEPPGSSWWPVVGAGAAMFGMLAVLEVAVVARLDDGGAVALTLAGWSALSLVGGVLVARRGMGPRARLVVLWLLPVSCCVLAGVSGGHVAVYVAVLVASGVLVAPALGLVSSEVARRAHGGERLRAYAWLQTGSWVGSAAAVAVAGLLADRRLGVVLLLAAVMGVGAIAGLGRRPQERRADP